MFRITNIEDINKIARELGNKVVTEVSKHVQKSISDNYIFVRYMGPKFVIVFCGVDPNNASDFVNDLKNSTETLNIALEEENFSTEELEKIKKSRGRKKRQNAIVSPTLNFVISTYYKGTGIETVLKSLEQYIDDASSTINEINSI